MRARITDIPPRLFINRILPFCEAKDVLSLCCTNRFFAIVAGSYSFAGSETIRMGGWKFPYWKLNPQVFVWGCATFLFFDVIGVFICSSMHSCICLIVTI